VVLDPFGEVEAHLLLREGLVLLVIDEALLLRLLAIIIPKHYYYPCFIGRQAGNRREYQYNNLESL
jgi:hypothetical protein